jgi:hypothetical protein
MSFLELGPIAFQEFAPTGWVFTSLTDWYALTDDKAPTVEKAQAHGAFGVGASWRSSAAVSFRAAYLGDSRQEALLAQQALGSVGATGPVVMSFTDDLLRTHRRVTVETIVPADLHGRAVYEVDVHCLARDPRMYGDAVSSTTGLPTTGGGLVFPVTFPLDFGEPGDPGRVQMTNAGSAPTAPTFAVAGGLDGFTLTEIDSGRRLVFDRQIPDGATVTVNMAARRVLIDGSDVTGFLTVREWWTIGPGQTSIVQFDGTDPVGTPTLTGYTESAWW